MGLLYQPRYFEPKNAVSVALPLFDDGSRIYTRDQLLIRDIATVARCIIVNHWPSRRSEKASRSRRNAAAALTRSAPTACWQSAPRPR
ncbi:MAG: hypothetical protein R2744_09765 [Bacteroidales bacterium]